jgi:hypothetical protein
VEQTRTISIDASQNIIIAGYFSGVVDFDPSSSVTNLNGGGQSSFLAKYSPNGTLIWAKNVGDILVNSIVCNNLNNIYYTGGYTGTADFDPSLTSFNLTSQGSNDSYICKLDNNGSFIWGKSIGGIDIEDSQTITLDQNGNIFISGFFAGACDFDPSSSSVLVNTNGYFDAFIAKYDNNGNYLWAHNIGGSRNDESFSVSTDLQGNCYVSGNFIDTVDFDPTMSTYNLISTGFVNTFIAKYNATGNFVWAKKLGSNGQVKGKSIHIDVQGNVVSTGDFNGQCDFDPGPSMYNLNSSSNSDIYVSKLDPNGNFLYAKGIFGNGSNFSKSISSDQLGNVFLVGDFQGTIDTNPSTGINYHSSAGSYDVILLSLDINGVFRWSGTIGGASDDLSHAIKLDSSRNVYINGTYRSSCDFDPSAAVNSLTSNGNDDVFLTKLNADFATDVIEISLNQPSRLYPNPFANQLILDGKILDLNSIRIYNVIGQDLSHQLELISQSESRIVFDMSKFSFGTYLLKTALDSKVIIKK